MYIYICTKLNSNRCNCFTENHKCQPHGGTRGKVRGRPKSAGFILKGPWMSVQNVPGHSNPSYSY